MIMRVDWLSSELYITVCIEYVCVCVLVEFTYL